MDERETIAEAVRVACLRSAAEAFEDGGLQGLCAEGRVELALQAIREVDLGVVLDAAAHGTGVGPQARPFGSAPPDDEE